MCDNQGESDWETDEETDIVVKLSGVIRDDFVKSMTADSKPKCVALGLMTENPMLQFGTQLFQGSYSQPTGTHLLLKESRAKDGGVTLKYHCNTYQQLDMKKLYVQEKIVANEFQKETPRQEGVVQEADKPSSSTTEESVKEADNTQEVEVQKDGGEKMET